MGNKKVDDGIKRRDRPFFLLFIIHILISLSFFACASTNAVRFKSAPIKEDSLNIKGYLYKPEGESPFPAVIILHGCGGIDEHHKNWAMQFVDWGYVAFVIDSFSARGVSNVCINPLRVSHIDRSLDTFGAATFLASLPYVDSDNIGIMGFSHGGSTVLQATQENIVYVAEMKSFPFKAAVSFYPYCHTSIMHQNTAVPTLILTGEKDDWTPADNCVALQKWTNRPDLVELVVYEGAYHSFDRRKPMRLYTGHLLGYNRSATQQAKEHTKRFFDYHLKETD